MGHLSVRVWKAWSYTAEAHEDNVKYFECVSCSYMVYSEAGHCETAIALVYYYCSIPERVRAKLWRLQEMFELNDRSLEKWLDAEAAEPVDTQVKDNYFRACS